MSEKSVKAKGGKGKFIIIVVILILVIGGGAFGGYLFFSKKKETTSANNAMVNPNMVYPNTAVTAGEVAANTINPAAQVSTGTYELGEFIVNLADDSGKKYIKVKIFLGYDVKNKKLATELEEKKPIVSDAIISVLRSKKSPDLNQKGVDDLKVQILMRISPLFKEGRPENVYFNEFLIQ